MLLHSTAPCAARPLCPSPAACWPLHNSCRCRRALPSIHSPTRVSNASVNCRSVLETASVMAGHSDDPLGMGSWPSLLLTCALMFLGAYGCGTLPRWLPNQQKLTASVAAVGAGLLLGSALCIMLPEGFEAAMEGEHHPPSWVVAAALLSGFWLMLALDSLSQLFPGLNSSHSHGSSSSHLPHRSLSDPEALSTTPQDGRVLHCSKNADSPGEHTVLLTDFAAQQDPAAGREALHSQYTPSWRPGSSPTKSRAAARSAALPGTPDTSAGGAAAAGAGASISAGGAPNPAITSVRRLANAAGSGSGGAAHPGSTGGAATASAAAGGIGGAAALSTDLATDTSSSGRERVTPSATGAQGTAAAAGKASGDAGGSGVGAPAGVRGPWWQPWLVDPTHHALLGLLVHSVSDGLAVGAASLSSLTQVSLGVATAMVVHKGPVAIGLATFLQGAGWSPTQVHKGVLLFALASPLAALLTYGFLSTLPGIADSIPLVVLFSGGTVLYAATMHILPGAMRGASSKVSQHHHHAALNRLQLLLVTLGMMLPLILSAVFAGHHHA